MAWSMCVSPELESVVVDDTNCIQASTVPGHRTHTAPPAATLLILRFQINQTLNGPSDKTEHAS